MTELNYRLDLVKQIFELCMKINEEVNYYAFFHLSPHVSDIDIDVALKTNFCMEVYKTRTYYKADFLTHEEMKKNLTGVIIKLESYLEAKK